MFGMLKQLIRPVEKTKAKVVMTGLLGHEKTLVIHNLIRRFKITGYMRGTDSFLELQLEGQRLDIENALRAIAGHPTLANIKSTNVTWLPYEGKLGYFMAY